MSNTDTNNGQLVDEDGEEVFPSLAPSPEELASTTRTVTVEPTTSSITTNVAMSRSTEYAKEKKEVNTFLKVALPDSAIITDAGGVPQINPTWLAAVEEIGKQMLNLCEVAAARQHGLEFASDDAGIIRVLNLFPGSKGGPAPTVAPGAFTPPPAVAAPVAAPVPAAAPVAPAPGVPMAAPAPVPGAFPAPAPQPQGQGGRTPSTNPLAWSNQTPEMQAWIISTVENWVLGGYVDPQVQNRMNTQEKYPGVTVTTPGGGVKVGGKTLLNNTMFGPNTKAFVNQMVGQGVNLG